MVAKLFVWLGLSLLLSSEVFPIPPIPDQGFFQNSICQRTLDFYRKRSEPIVKMLSELGIKRAPANKTEEEELKNRYARYAVVQHQKMLSQTDLFLAQDLLAAYKSSEPKPSLRQLVKITSTRRGKHHGEDEEFSEYEEVLINTLLAPYQTAYGKIRSVEWKPEKQDMNLILMAQGYSADLAEYRFEFTKRAVALPLDRPIAAQNLDPIRNDLRYEADLPGLLAEGTLPADKEKDIFEARTESGKSGLIAVAHTVMETEIVPENIRNEISRHVDFLQKYKIPPDKTLGQLVRIGILIQLSKK